MTRYEKAIEISTGAAEVLERYGEALPEVQKTRFRVLATIRPKLEHYRSLTGLRVGVVEDSEVPQGTAGFITNANDVFITLGTLVANDNNHFDEYVVHHEAEHERNGMKEEDMPVDQITPEERKGIEAEIGETLPARVWDPKQHDILEGCNDHLTARRVGKHSMSGYDRFQVPLAEKLNDALLRRFKTLSLFGQFSAGRGDQVIASLRLLGQAGMTKQAVERTLAEGTDIPAAANTNTAPLAEAA